MSLKTTLYQHYFKNVYLQRTERAHAQRVMDVRRRGHANVVFILSSLSMWRCQRLYDLLASDSRFSPYLILYPFPNYTEEERASSIVQLQKYLKDRGISGFDLSREASPGSFLKSRFDPDIIFYPQPYNELFSNDLDSLYFEDRLLCYVPYGCNVISESWPFSQRFSNIAWRLFYSSNEDGQVAQSSALNKGKNVKVVGFTAFDQFADSGHTIQWKKQECDKKKVIWAPHYSITDTGPIQHGSFLEIYDTMLEMARQFQTDIQFVFKPHPRLLSELYEYPGWGKERTDNYYRCWKDGANTQLVTGDYVDLFLSSDAMIHDSVSFMAEYHFSHQPALYTTGDVQQTKRQLNELGKRAIDAHYLGKQKSEIISFLENVVLGGEDPLRNKRLAFYNDYLIPPGGKSVAEIIYEDLIESLKLNG